MDNYSNVKNGLSEFLNSNSLVAKVAFLLLVAFVFVMVLQICTTIILAFSNRKSSLTKLTNGMIDATQMSIVPQDPSAYGAKTLPRSVNQNGGLEFTWSVWLFINDLGNPDGKYHHIFHKGNLNTETNGLNFPNNSPGLYISPNKNELTLIMNTYDVINEEVIIPNIPINKWLNVVIRCTNKKVDVYINGTIAKSVTLVGVPKQNYGDVYMAMNGGFNGFISNLWYYSYALGTTAIQDLARGGPNTKMLTSQNYKNKISDYLSLRWYFYGNNDQYNP
jgi:hypothetical protein